MTRTIPDEDLEILHLKLSGTYRHRSDQMIYAHTHRRLRGNEHEHEYIAVGKVNDLLCALNELRARRAWRRPARQGKTSLALQAMRIGETIILPPMTFGALSTAKATARRKLSIPNASWHAHTLPDRTLRILRLPNGETKPPKENPLVDIFSSMRIGESRVVEFRGRLQNNVKVLSRRKLGDRYADWKTRRQTQTKVLVRRYK